MLLTVLMPVYNAENYLRKAIDSVLCQKFEDFELLILNDGSTDGSVGIIKNYQDERIRLVHNEQNLGLIRTLNKGITLAQGKYIARHDADDTSHPKRFQKQLAFLENNPAYALLGTRARIWHGRIPSPFIYAHQFSHENIKVELLFNSPFAHGSIMAKTSVLQKFLYDENYPVAEDYELWSRVASEYSVANLPEILYNYRFHAGGESVIKTQVLLASVQSIRANALLNMGFSIEEIDPNAHFLLASRGVVQRYSEEDISKIALWIERILLKNKETQTYPHELLSQQLGTLWAKVFQNELSLWLRGWQRCKALREIIPISFITYLFPNPIKAYHWFFRSF